MKTYIKFTEIYPDATRKTKKWSVLNKENEAHLGFISWYGAWRRYCFYANATTIFEQNCLRDIANFIELQTKLYNDSKK